MYQIKKNNTNSQENSKNSDSDLFGLILVLLSSILLGIWAVKETIALRNILLVCGTLISIYYIFLELRSKALNKDIPFTKLLPLILLACSFLWVLAHYFLFAIDHVKQLDELKSTWLRALLASIVGLGTGLALRNYPNRLNLLWLGIFIAFLVLYCQYIPRALALNKLLVPDYDHYLFHLKINTVLMGMILIAGIDGALLDHLRMVGGRLTSVNFWFLLYWLSSTILALWAFVYIVDARNGIGLSMILYSFWIFCVLVFFIRSRLRGLNTKYILTFSITGLGLCLILYFAFLQMTVNKGWHALIEDTKVAVQIDRFPNWQNISQMGYPKRDDGKVVTPNNYERVAWATAGARAIMLFPQGVGTLAYPFSKHPEAPPKMEVSPNIHGIATHSGWVELGLAFGMPILGLIFSAILIAFIDASRHPYPARMTILGLLILIFFLYMTGEVAIQHGIEILYYLLALIAALLLTKPRQIEINA